MMNVFSFTGRLGRDAESRTTPKGTAVLSFTVANDVGYGDNKKTNWVKCAMFGKRAEGSLKDYLVKGTEVAISGELTLDEYDTKDGEHRANLSVFVNELTLVGGKKESNANTSPQAELPVQGNSAPPADLDDSDVPF
jgi:single-strand DNA-binding protein